MQAKHVGTGHADLTKWEWLTHQHRDSLASFIGHPPLLSFMALAQGQSSARTKSQLLQSMIQPWYYFNSKYIIYI